MKLHTKSYDQFVYEAKIKWTGVPDAKYSVKGDILTVEFRNLKDWESKNGEGYDIAISDIEMAALGKNSELLGHIYYEAGDAGWYLDPEKEPKQTNKTTLKFELK